MADESFAMAAIEPQGWPTTGQRTRNALGEISSEYKEKRFGNKCLTYDNDGNLQSITDAGGATTCTC
jgi:hypothetical protein